MAFRITYHLLKYVVKPRSNILIRFPSRSSSTSSAPSASPSTSTGSTEESPANANQNANPKDNPKDSPQDNPNDNPNDNPKTNKKQNKQKSKKQKSKKQNPKDPNRPQTPLDKFFSSFKNFNYKPSRFPSDSWKQLASSRGWPLKPKKAKDVPGRDAYDRYHKALAEEVELWFGNEKDIKAWKTLCRAVGHADAPDSIKECKAILRGVHVNIVDLVHWGRNGGEEADDNTAPKVFKSLQGLKDYTRQTKKYFLKAQLGGYHGGNVVLKRLLRRLLS